MLSDDPVLTTHKHRDTVYITISIIHWASHFWGYLSTIIPWPCKYTTNIHSYCAYKCGFIVWLYLNCLNKCKFKYRKCMHQKLSLTVNVKMFPFISFNHIILTISERSNFSLFFFKMQSSQKLSGPKILQVKRRT